MLNNVIIIRITSLHGSQPPSMVFASKTATFGSELQVSMGSSLHLWFCAYQNSDFSIRIPGLYGTKPSFVAFCIQNRAFSTRIASLYGSQPSYVVLCIHNSDIMTRIFSLYWSQTSPMSFCIQKIDFSTRIASLHGSHSSSVV